MNKSEVILGQKVNSFLNGIQYIWCDNGVIMVYIWGKANNLFAPHIYIYIYI